jgi:hypothetical protein
MFSLQMRHASGRFLLGFAFVLIVVFAFQEPALAAKPKQKTFESPEAAVDSLITALRAHDEKALRSLFGPGSEPIISSGDAGDDRERREKFVRLYDERQRLQRTGEKKVILIVGNNDWPFPIPIVKTGRNWRFDTKAGKEEIIHRRIGENEEGAIQTCLAIVDAQREYATVDRDGDGLLKYSPKFQSTKGKRDGLYWEAEAGEPPSPLGPLVAQARSEGHRGGEKPEPYNGYFFRILTAQGKSAKGGAYSYLAKGKMVGGFAIVAFPAAYRTSGVKTFIVNHDGVVYQKDLGPETAKLAQALKVFNPDKTWGKAE